MAWSSFYPILKKIYQTGETFEGKGVLFPLARHEGGPLEDIYFDFIYQPRFNEQGEVEGIIAFGYEVTTQVVARKQAEESRQRFQMLSEAIPQMVWTVTPDGQADYYNHQWYAYTGLDFAQSRGQVWTQVVHPQDLGNLEFHWLEALQTRQPYQVEARLRRADGTYRWFLIRAMPLKDEAGNVKQWFGRDTDIEERKEVEKDLYQVSQELFTANGELAAANEETRASHEELAATNQRLVHINADLDNFIYTASHDLKAPILNIEGLLKVLIRRIDRQAGEDKEVQNIFTLMQDSVLHFKETISDLTDIVRIQKQTEQESELVDLPQIVQDTLSDLAGQIEEARAQIETRQAECSAIVFPRKNLKSVVYNLLSNALKYRHPQRPLHILLSCYREGNYQVVSVQDNGLGVNSIDRDKIFGMIKRCTPTWRAPASASTL
jgi:PAS domain S-box-containing protein